MFSTVQSSPIEPHIPEDPTREQVLALLEWMDYGVCYYQQGDTAPSPDNTLPGGQVFKLEPVMGIHWRTGRDPNTTTLYIDGKPYTFSTTWVYVTLGRQKDRK